MSSIDFYSILEIVNDENEDRCKEIDCVYDRERKIKLCCSNGQAMNDYNKVSFEDVIEISIVFVVNSHIVIPYNCVVKEDRNDTTN